jgi:hypothetical protein
MFDLSSDIEELKGFSHKYNAGHHLAAESESNERPGAKRLIGGGSGEWLC